MPFADFDDTLMSFRVVVDDPYKVTLRALQYRALRHENRVRAHRTGHACTHELSGPQSALSIRKRRTNQERARFRAERRIGEVNMALIGKLAAVGQQDSHDEVVISRKPKGALGDLVAVSEQLVLGDAEVHPHRIELVDIRQQAGLSGRHIAAVLLSREARQTVERRFDRRIAEVELCRLHLPLGGDHGRFRALLVAGRVVQILLAQSVLRGERDHAREIRLRHVEPRLLLRELALGRLQRGLKWFRVHQEERLPGMDQLTLGIDPLIEKAVHAGANLHFT